MPRRSQGGGMRVGAPGTAYPNRSDLNPAQTLPARAAAGQTYGTAGQQLAAQQQVPMAPQPLVGFPGAGPTAPPLPAPPPAQPVGPGGGPPPGLPAIVPGGLGPYAGPTQRPDEPVTAGAPIGAGPGPEALAASPLAPASGVGAMSAMLARAAQATGSPTLFSLLQRAQAAGL